MKPISREERFRSNFNAALKQSGKSLTDVANETGISIEVLSRWKNQGRTRCKTENLEAVAKSLGIEPRSLFGKLESRGNGIISSSVVKAVEKHPELNDKLGHDGMQQLSRDIAEHPTASEDEILYHAKRVVWIREYATKAAKALAGRNGSWLANAIDMALKD